MVPSSLSAVLVFVLLVAPGLLYDLLTARYRAGAPESTFREASRVVLASALFTLAAGAVLLTACLIAWRPAPDLRRLLVDASYQRENALVLALAPALLSAVACGLAGAFFLWKRRDYGPALKRESMWHRAFTMHAPPGHYAFARVRTKSGLVYMGKVAGYSVDINLAGRELLLKPPLWIRREGGNQSPVHQTWQRVLLSSDEIVSVMVSFRPMDTDSNDAHSARESAEQTRNRID